MQNLQTEGINLLYVFFIGKLFQKEYICFIVIWACLFFFFFWYKCLLPISPSPQLVYSGNKSLTLTLRSLVFQTVQSAESKGKNRCELYQTSRRVMHKCWEFILEIETTEVIPKGEHVPLMHLLWLKAHTPPSPFSTLFLPRCLTHPWGHKKMGTHQRPPKVPPHPGWSQGTKWWPMSTPPTSSASATLGITGVTLVSPIKIYVERINKTGEKGQLSR